MSLFARSVSDGVSRSLPLPPPRPPFRSKRAVSPTGTSPPLRKRRNGAYLMRRSCSLTLARPRTRFLLAMLHTVLLRTVALCVVACGVLPRPASAQSHWFNEVVKSGAVDCFYEVLEEKVPVRATAVVVDGGRLDIRLVVQHTYDMHQVRAESPKTVHVKTFRDIPEMQHLDFITEQGGEYSFCFDNRAMPPTSGIDVHAVPTHRLDIASPLSGGDKVVAFELHFRESAEKAHRGSTPKKAEKEGLVDKKKRPAEVADTVPIKGSLDNLESLLENIESEANYMHYREEQNRNTGESNNSRVMYLTLIETAVLLLVSSGQAYMIRSWFAQYQPARAWA